MYMNTAVFDRGLMSLITNFDESMDILASFLDIYPMAPKTLENIIRHLQLQWKIKLFAMVRNSTFRGMLCLMSQASPQMVRKTHAIFQHSILRGSENVREAQGVFRMRFMFSNVSMDEMRSNSRYVSKKGFAINYITHYFPMVRFMYFSLFFNWETIILQTTWVVPFFRRVQNDLYVFDIHRMFLWTGLYPTQCHSHHLRGKIHGLTFVCPALSSSRPRLSPWGSKAKVLKLELSSCTQPYWISFLSYEASVVDASRTVAVNKRLRTSQMVTVRPCHSTSQPGCEVEHRLM